MQCAKNWGKEIADDIQPWPICQAHENSMRVFSDFQCVTIHRSCQAKQESGGLRHRSSRILLPRSVPFRGKTAIAHNKIPVTLFEELHRTGCREHYDVGAEPLAEHDDRRRCS